MPSRCSRSSSTAPCCCTSRTSLQQKEAEQKYVNGILDRKIELLPLGQGDLPIRELVAMAPNVDAVIVELDYCNVEMFQAIEESYRFLTSNGIAAGNK